MDEHELRQRVDAIDWWHPIELPYSIVTPGRPHHYAKLAQVLKLLPEDLAGLKVLDLGAWDGLYSFTCARRGAKVTAVDMWQRGRERTDQGFDLVSEVYGYPVEKCQGDVVDAPWGNREFDVVLCLGLLYHLRHPLLALDVIRKACGWKIIIETHVEVFNVGQPAAAFYPGDVLNHDGSNWFGPNPECVLAWLTEAGFVNAEAVDIQPADYAPRAARMFATAEGG